MTTFSYDFPPSKEVFYVTEFEAYNTVKKGIVLQVEFISFYVDEDNISSEHEYLILNSDSKETLLVKPENVFETESEALMYAYENLEVTPTPTPSVTTSITPTPTPTPSAT